MPSTSRQMLVGAGVVALGLPLLVVLSLLGKCSERLTCESRADCEGILRCPLGEEAVCGPKAPPPDDEDEGLCVCKPRRYRPTPCQRLAPSCDPLGGAL